MSKEAGNPAILNMHIIHTEKAKLPWTPWTPMW
jgi:hypothetical protein